MKLSVKMSLAMGALVILIAGSNLFSIYQTSEVNKTSTVLADELIPSLVSIQTANTLFSDFRIAEIQHAIATDSQIMRNYEQELDKVHAAFKKEIGIYEKKPMNSERRRLFDQFMRLNNEYMQLNATVIDLSRNNKVDEVMKMINSQCRELYRSATAVLTKLVEHNVAEARSVSANGDKRYASARFSLSALLVMSMLLALSLTFTIVRGVQRQLGRDPGELAALAQRVSQGDYVIVDSSPKVGVYGRIVDMVETLKEHIAKAQAESNDARAQSARAQTALESAEVANREARSKTEAMLRAAEQLESVAVVVSSASEQLSAQIEESERGAAEQASRVAETATAMEEMNSTVVEVAKNAGNAADVSNATRKKAESGAGIVKEAVASIQKVQQCADLLRNDMGKLDDSAKSISQIMNVISDIADQTNLLALNAAIEAARAGEAGRGFAVVADEVRKLAEKTMTSTTDVGNAIRAIQQSANQSMRQMDESVKLVEQATLMANQSGEALQEIVKMVDSTADQVRAIATASEQQSATSEQINRSIMQVNTIAGETARSMSDASRAVSDLTGQANALAKLIDEMKRG